MKIINAILEPDADGTLHLPLPPEWRSGPVRVQVQLELVPEQEAIPPVKERRLGRLPGFRMSADFDEPLDDFKPYME